MMAKAMMSAISDGGEEKRKVIKTIPIRSGWKDVMKDMLDVRNQGLEKGEELKKLTNEYATKKKLFWATVEKDLGIYDKNMRLNDEDTEIDILEDEDEDEDKE